MIKLEDVYEKKALFYYCNTCGDINLPEDKDILTIHDSEELPLRERNLYDNYWYEGSGASMYVVKYNGETAMAIGFLFDESFCSDILKKSQDDVSNEDMERFYRAVNDYAGCLENDKAIDGCEVVVGKDTDPAGHELLVIIPYELRHKIKEITTYLDERVYSSVEELM